MGRRWGWGGPPVRGVAACPGSPQSHPHWQRGPPQPGLPSPGTLHPKACRARVLPALFLIVSQARVCPRGGCTLPCLLSVPPRQWPLPLYFPPPTGHSPQAACHPPTPTRVGPPSSPQSPVCLCDLSLPVPILAGRTGSPTLPGPGQPLCPTSIGQAGPARAPPSASHHTFLGGFESQVQAPSPL